MGATDPTDPARPEPAGDDARFDASREAIVRLLVERDAARTVTNAAELKEEVARLLKDPVERAAMGSRGQDVLTAHRGATARTVRELISPR